MNMTMSRRRFLASTGAGAAAGLAGCGGGTTDKERQSAQERPNIILIMADDMGYSDIGCYGGGIDTPNIDRLAAGGLKYRQFYNTARCCPTRASLLTGLYPHQAGIGHMMEDAGYDGYRGELNDSCRTIAEVLKHAGYGAYMSGKWHVTKHLGRWTEDEKLMSTDDWPCQRGFDRFYGTIIGCGSFYDPITLVRDNTPIAPEGDDYFYTDAIADNAIGFMDDHRKERPDDPFFCYVSFTAPHWPLHAPAGDIAKYAGRFDAGWDRLREERLARMIDMDVIDPSWDLTERDPRVPAWEDADDKDWEVRRMEVYAAMIDRMDRNIGRIVSHLERTGEAGNTLIIFLADNGGCAENLSENIDAMYVPDTTLDGRTVRRGNISGLMPGPDDTYQSYATPWANVSNTPFRLYKHWVHEGGISTPLILHWPAGIGAKGGWRDEPGHLVDIMATCADLAGADYATTPGGGPATPLEGMSLVPTFTGAPLEREAIYWEHEGNRAVRKGDWKLVSRYPGGWELYDMKRDRTELNDLAADHPDIVNDLAALYSAWAARAGVQPWDRVREGIAAFRKEYNNRWLPAKKP